ncbi:MAG: sugar-binding transcriptional regulator [Bacillota bacterium]
MKASRKKQQLLYSIAYEYYINGAKQKEIADKYNINRVQVSRYLTEAREKGIVEFRVKNPLEEESRNIEEEIETHFPVKRALVTVTARSGNNYLLKALAHKASDYINQTFKPHDVIGVGWGSTIYQVARDFTTDKEYNNIGFVPLVGSSFQFDKEFQANNISIMLGEEFKGKGYSLMAPFWANNRQEYETIVQNNDVRRVLDMWQELDRILIGIGCNFSKTPLMKMDEIREKELTKLLNFKQVGDMLTHYFNLYGEFCDLDIYRRLINFPLEYFDRVDEVIAIAGGNQKKDSLIGAFRTGKIDTIILDSATAQEIIKEVRR